MATQAALIADTIIGMKKALRRERDDVAPDDPIAQPTNRGNKMRANAKYVREGAMGYIDAEDFYREKVEHAGYTRRILKRNPIRYDSEGDELLDDDEDSETDTTITEENPFAGVVLETLLCPLKHPSELPTHPSMSQPYTSRALEHMTAAVDEKLRQERALLWRARNLHRQFLGDAGWMPCGIIETPDDRDNPTLADSPSINGHVNSNPEESFAQNGQPENDVEMTAEASGGPVPNDIQDQNKVLKSEEADAGVNDLPPHPKPADEPNHAAGDLQMDGTNNGAATNTDVENREAHDDEIENDAEMHDGFSPEPPRRMTTRAQANATNPQDDGNQSPTFSADSASSLPNPHPLFLFPENILPDANFGLPPTEAEETRRLLWSYVQKQEETVRGFEHMLDSLRRACHMKSDVLEWCKAEGHVGEMSDGEDWYDREKWGLAEGEDLKKGTDDDEGEVVDDSRTTAKRGRRRA
ncbi:hypothetical protein N7470_007400 [Penicillium chermesinum]|nr:hypothetical protein N7470_007400 [Penicillium chermesinum]